MATPPIPPDRAAARALAALDLASHLADPSRKQAFVTPMFDVIAPRYDAFTRAFSFGMDARWKRVLVDAALAALPSPDGVRTAVDLACGTGDLAMAVASRCRGASVLGIDASPRMVEAAARRNAASAPRVAFAAGDAMRLDLPDASVDLLTAGYCYRNLPDWRGALREAARVLRPGGVFADLDFFRPALAPWRALFLWYLRRAGDLVGWAWHRAPVVYGYIAPSIAGFCTRDEFTEGLRVAGLEPVDVRSRLGGGVALHVARKR